MHGIKIQSAVILNAKATTRVLLLLTRIVHITLTVAVVSLYFLLVLNFFPWTKSFAQILLKNVTSPLDSFASSCIHFLPNLFVISIISLFAICIIKIIHFFFIALEQERIEIKGFYPLWAKPTYDIARVLIVAFALVIILPYLPGWDSPAFKQVGLFLGILVSLGSTSAVAHAISGVVLTYTRAFQVGDTIKIDEHTGTVIEKSLFVTRMKTPTREVISIPNNKVLGGNIINYSIQAKDGGVAICSLVSIGYDQPWQTVKELLLAAAKDCKLVLDEPAPKVLQHSLGDYSVIYEIRVYIDQPDKMIEIHSDLHELIQTKFNEADVEIRSPQYSSLRDGNQSTVPVKFLPKEYEAPSFHVSS